MAREEIDRWVEIAAAQLDAARRLDAARLSVLTEERAHVQDQVTPVEIAGWSVEDQRYAADAAHRVRQLDQRTLACGSIVVQALASVLPGVGPTTYGRRGALRNA